MSVTQIPHTTSPADVWYLDIADIEFYFGSQTFDPVTVCADVEIPMRFPGDATLALAFAGDATLPLRFDGEANLRLRC